MMRFRLTASAKFWLLLTVIVSGSLPERSWASSESGPELVAPNAVLMTPTVDPAPKPEGDTQTQGTNPVTDRTSSTVVEPSPSASHDGWVTKGSRPQTRNMSSGSSNSTSSSLTPPPASLPGTQVVPQTSVPMQKNASQGAVLPYPYGTPASVPEYLGHSQSPQNGPVLRQIIPGERVPDRSGGVLGSVGRWWNSLWGKKPIDQPPTTTFGSGNVPNGWTTGISPSPGTSTPWVTTRPVTPGATASPGSTATPIVQPYATPYALPPRSAEGSPVLSLPLTANPSHPSQAATGGTFTSTPTSRLSSSSGVSLSTPSGMLSQPAQGQNASPSGLTDSSVYGGWSATPPVTSSDPSHRSTSTSTLPPYPQYSSGFGTAMPFPSPSQPRSAIWNGGVLTPRQEKASPSLMDRIRTWWADVTAPKGIQGRQALLPSQPGSGRLLGAGFRERSPSVPSTDPFSSYGVASAGSVSAPSPGVSVTHQSPAVLPPPAPQLPLRQAW